MRYGLSEDTIKFGNGIDVKDIRFAKKGGNLNISLIGSDDSVSIEVFFCNAKSTC